MFAKLAVFTLLGVSLAVPDRRPQQYAPPAQPFQPAPAPSYQPAPAPSFHSAPRRPSYDDSFEDAPPKYNYDYRVHDDYYGVNFNQQETRDGHNTQGSYFVALPDGRQQTVTYYVNGDSGYVAEVNYEGEAQYPEQQSYQPAPQQAYQPAPQPSFQPAPQPSYQPAPQPPRPRQPAPRPNYG